MPLSEDQKAMLRLLAQREQGYEDIGALMGLSVEEVRLRVKEALDELGESVDSGASVESRVSEAPQDEENSPPPAPVPAAKPDPPASATRTRGTTPMPARPQQAPPAGKRAAPRLPRLSVPPGRRRLMAIAGGALALVGVVLLAVLLIGGDSGSGTTASNASEASAPTGRGMTEAVLAPVGGGDARGRALFGRVKNTAVLQVQAEGLAPSPDSGSYTVWLYRSPKLALRVGAVKVSKSGGIAAQFPVPTELLAIVSSGTFKRINISLTDDAAYKAELAKAKKQKRLPAYSGETVLSGEIKGPIVER
jgi:hypothetical protein